jgi:hypothetical protein
MKALEVSLVSALLFGMTGCASNHHLVFFTNTTIGLEIASDPTGGSPAKFILGYKRQEGVIDPLIPNYDYILGENGELVEPDNGDTNIVMTRHGTAIPKGENKSHSVLAKMNFGATGGGTGAAASQFFATGKAAELLAQSPGISGALSGDPEINIAKSIDFVRGGEAVFTHLDVVYQMLNESITSGKKADEAKNIKFKVDDLDNGNFKVTFKNYSWVDSNKIKLEIKDYDVKKDKHEFPNTYQYLKTLAGSLIVAKQAILTDGVTVSDRVLTGSEKKQMVSDIETFLAKYNEGEKLLSSNKDVLAMIDYVYSNVLIKTSEK